MQAGKSNITFVRKKTYINPTITEYIWAVRKVSESNSGGQVKIKTLGIRWVKYGNRVRIFFHTRRQVLVKTE